MVSPHELRRGHRRAFEERRRDSRYPRYGWRLDPCDPKLIEPHRSEQHVIRLLLELKEKGLGYRAMVAKLEEMEIPPRRAERWDWRTIRVILLRETGEAWHW